MVGIENVSGLELHQLSDKFLLGTLKDKLLNVSAEVQTKSQINSNIFKQVVTGDFVQADVKHKPPFIFRPIAKHVFSMNEIPVITDRTYAMSRRLLVIRFNETFSGKTEDKWLEEKLTKELPGILNWALTGLPAVLESGEIEETDKMKEDKREFIRAINPVLSFVEETCETDNPSPSCPVSKDELYKAYRNYCDDSGLMSLSKPKFYDQLLRDFPSIKEIRPHGGIRYFEGIELIG